MSDSRLLQKEQQQSQQASKMTAEEIFIQDVMCAVTDAW